MEHSAITESVLESSFEVSNELGVGFLESVYENALFLALKQRGVKVLQQAPLNVYFRGESVGRFQIDLLVEDQVIVELKSAKALIPEHQMQVLNYLRASELPVALLVNFGNPKLEYRRFENRFLKNPSPSSPLSQ